MGNFELENQIFIASRKTIQTLLKEDNGSDAIALYFFYYETAKRQQTEQIRATDVFVMKGLKWGEKRFRVAKAILKKHGLVENIKSNSKDGNWYLRISYIKRTTPQSHGVRLSPTTPQSRVLQNTKEKESNKEKENIYILNAYTNTNVLDDDTPKRGASCPLSKSPLKEKYPKGHIECVEYVTSFRFVNKGKQFRNLHNMLRSGLDFSDIDRILVKVEKKPFYQENGWDFATLAAEADRSNHAS